MEGNGIVGEDRKADHAFVSDDFDAVFTGGVMGHETPRTASHQAAVKLKAGTDGIFGLIEPATVALESAGFKDVSEDFLQEVYLMRGQVVEISPPRQCRAVRATASFRGCSPGCAEVVRNVSGC